MTNEKIKTREKEIHKALFGDKVVLKTEWVEIEPFNESDLLQLEDYLREELKK